MSGSLAKNISKVLLDSSSFLGFEGVIGFKEMEDLDKGTKDGRTDIDEGSLEIFGLERKDIVMPRSRR